jgi:hypothetical protein
MPDVACVAIRNPISPRFERLSWLWWTIVAVNWWALTDRQIRAAGLGSGDAGVGASVTTLALAAVAGRFIGFAFETGFYTLWWRAWGSPLRFGPLFNRISLLSLIDVAAGTIGDLARERGGGLAAWMAPVVGFGVVADASRGALPAALTAFGTTGLLTLLRIGLTARFQALARGRRMLGPLVLVFFSWLATRLVTAWTIDLARGMSPSP